ncbi:MAG: anaerobic carbon-monoxide dehydrogenase catalytic subunit [Actinobacteria bacterium]|nr:MAG: anaerobic carbon-monoxide dehydrogenase catalytic subunit [Actinomycetota bacterium]
MAETETKEQQKTIDEAAEQLLAKAERENVATAWIRVQSQKGCAFGKAGTCCRMCVMGPCRINPKDPESSRGICGATADTIVARNLVRMVAAGTAAHSDHGRAVAHQLKMTARGELKPFAVADKAKLVKVAGEFGISPEGKSTEQLAEALADAASAQFGQQDGELTFLARAPEKRRKLWEKLGIAPRGVDREVVELMHRTAIGVDQDYENLIMAGLRTAMADGWGGSMIGTELTDIMLGTPTPSRTKVNLGVLKEDQVNIIVHGHEPALSAMIVKAAKDADMVKAAESAGASGINIAGMCCTGNEVLMRNQVPIAGNFLHQELAIVTGAVEAMVVDVQCVMSSLPEVASCYHTKIITTSDRAKIRGAMHMEFNEERAFEVAKEIVKTAIENYPNRRAEDVEIPSQQMDLVAGFSHETINYMLGGRFRASYRPLNDAIMAPNRIRGVAGVVGCNNARYTQDAGHIAMVKELISNNVLVVQTGCGAVASAKAGLLTPEAIEMAGPGLREVCEAVGIPPVLHAGSCVDNSRILVALCAMVAEGGLGEDISDLPVAAAAPEWMSEKAMAIGFYAVASGVFTVFGPAHPVGGGPGVGEMIFRGLEELTGGMFADEEDPIAAAHLMIEHIDRKRKALGI